MADLQGPKIRVGKFDGRQDRRSSRARRSCSTPRAPSSATSDARRPRLQGAAARRASRATRCCSTTACIVLDGRRGAGERGAHHGRASAASCPTTRASTRQGGGLTAPALTAKDMEDIKTAMSFQADYLAVSFPKSATDMEMARQLATSPASRGATSRG